VAEEHSAWKVYGSEALYLGNGRLQEIRVGCNTTQNNRNLLLRDYGKCRIEVSQDADVALRN
jgi:hypothetical protein